MRHAARLTKRDSTNTRALSTSSPSVPIAPDAVQRVASVPYKDGSVDKTVLINDAAREAIRAHKAERFVSIIDPESEKLGELLRVVDAGWNAIGVKAKNAGHHTLWPEAFEAGKALLEEAFPDK